MDPNKRRNKAPSAKSLEGGAQSSASTGSGGKKEFGEETDQDREKAIADAEWKNLWDATEVIDMDKW
ncbi:MAG: hypothetical protein ABW047_14620 [Nitrospiraceae bacterium]